MDNLTELVLPGPFLFIGRSPDNVRVLGYGAVDQEFHELRYDMEQQIVVSSRDNKEHTAMYLGTGGIMGNTDHIKDPEWIFLGYDDLGVALRKFQKDVTPQDDKPHFSARITGVCRGEYAGVGIVKHEPMEHEPLKDQLPVTWKRGKARFIGTYGGWDKKRLPPWPRGAMDIDVMNSAEEQADAMMKVLNPDYHRSVAVAYLKDDLEVCVRNARK